MKNLIIVEGGINHEGDFKLACEMMYIAREAGASTFKWQLYDTNTFIQYDHPLYNKRKEILDVMHSYSELTEYGRTLGLEVGYSIFTRNFFRAMHQTDFLKIAARQLDDRMFMEDYVTYIRRHDISGMPIFCSYRKGQSLDFIDDCNFSNLCLLGVVSKYPHTYAEGIALVDRTSIERADELLWGVSIHCPDIDLIDYAIRSGATFVEVHFTLDHSQSSFRDHEVGFDPDELEKLFEHISAIQQIKH